MKKIIFVFFALFVLISCARKDGYYPVDKGWDGVVDGREYRFRVEPDGLYLYTDWDSGDMHRISMVHKMNGNYVKEATDGLMKFLCVNKDNDYVYVMGYENVIDYYSQKIIAVTMSVNDSIGFFFSRKDIEAIGLLEKYMKR